MYVKALQNTFQFIQITFITNCRDYISQIFIWRLLDVLRTFCVKFQKYTATFMTASSSTRWPHRCLIFHYVTLCQRFDTHLIKGNPRKFIESKQFYIFIDFTRRKDRKEKKRKFIILEKFVFVCWRWFMGWKEKGSTVSWGKWVEIIVQFQWKIELDSMSDIHSR